MLDAPDFKKKQVIVFIPKDGDTISYRNDNIIIKDKSGITKYQVSCYQLFAVFVIGNISITNGIIMRAKKFKYSICMMTTNMRVYHIINGNMEGNTLLHLRQYDYKGLEIGQHIVWNKIYNQKQNLNRIRNKNADLKASIRKLDSYLAELAENEYSELQSLLGVEGSASRIYFSGLFSDCNWKGRKPRVKHDYINTVLDIGYTMLFNFVDCVLQLYGFDVYYGVLHRCFYMRKSLVCDIMEPFRVIIDYKVLKAIHLGQCKEEDFEMVDNQWVLKYRKIGAYTSFLMETILEYKMDIFYYVQAYYRSFMKNKPFSEYPVYEVK